MFLQDQDDMQETIINEVLRKFCRYLNMWWNAEKMNKDEQDPYTPDKFMILHPEQGLYGETNWQVLKDLEGPGDDKPTFQDGLIRVEANDGDEGGGNVLWVGLQGTNMGRDLDYDCQIAWIAHTFDLSTCMIYTEGQMSTPPNGDLKET
jgi:hypothetical protein